MEKQIKPQPMPGNLETKRCTQRSTLSRSFAAAVIVSIMLAFFGTINSKYSHRKEYLQPQSSDHQRASKRADLWQPAVGSTWNYQLLHPPSDTQLQTPALYSVWGIDLFDTPASTVSTIQAAGSHVICYFSAGSYEPNRPDSGNFTDADLGHGLDGWPGERWLNINSTNVRNIMTGRISLAAQKGCNGVDPDNMDGYQNTNGLGLTESDSIDYMLFLASEARSHSLSIGLKNAAAIISDVLNVTQWCVNEECTAYSECSDFQPFIAAGKPVFNIEYPKGSVSNDMNVSAEQYNHSCDDPDAVGFSKIIKNIVLDEWIESCLPLNGSSQNATDSGSGGDSGSSGKGARLSLFEHSSFWILVGLLIWVAVQV